VLPQSRRSGSDWVPGHLIADIVSGHQPIVDPRPYRPDRFNQSTWGKAADF
jgi:hypothetical protein